MRLWPVFPLAIILMNGTPVHADETIHRFSERAAIYAADQMCGLFNHDQRTALSAGYWQARGAALRATDDARTLTQIDAQARIKARQMGCSHEQIQAIAERLYHAFDAFSRTTQVEYPATHSSWLARRNVEHGWVATQSTNTGYVFGLYRNTPGSKPNLAGTAQTGKVISARLWLPEPGDALPAGDKLYARPLAMMRAYWASGHRNRVWIFPEDATEAFANLDPRSVAVIELIGYPTQKWAVEVGDYRAAAAFSRIGTTNPHTH